MSNRTTLLIGVVLLVLLALAPLDLASIGLPYPGLRRYGTYILTLWLVTAIAAMGVNLIVGYAGQETLAQAAFVGIGAYLTAIATKSGVQIFSVEVATTEDEKQKGLVYRKELADGKGMLFDFSPEQQVSMWMKNTYVSLDMIFIRADGRILRIAENTEPMSTKIISSGGLAKGVLEVVAGTAQKYGIQPGDRVAHPLFSGK